MKRQDWLEQLWNELHAAELRPYEYGACVRMAAGVVDAMLEQPPIRHAELVEPLIAAAREHPITLDELKACVTGLFGEPIPINLADRGDLVLLDLPDAAGPALGICTGPRIACPKAPAGVAYLRRVRGLTFWRVA